LVFKICKEGEIGEKGLGEGLGEEGLGVFVELHEPIFDLRRFRSFQQSRKHWKFTERKRKV
jgi:hypothetical protein